ncbi:MAG: hypothetical protein HY868_25440 [Chloroflexi bacterium]|nr:hypothetical protein [Chloroflexota bacterium]
MTQEQIRATWLAALMERLGPDGMIRFLLQFETGSGDYSTERHRWLDHLTIDQAIERVQQNQEPAQ